MVRTYRFAVILVGVSTLFASASASAPALAQAPAERDKELTTLASDLDRETNALSTSDCAAACRALASIRRAADRICALDPNERCTEARAKAEAASKRVRDACPTCSLAFGSAPAPPPPATPAPAREPTREHMGKGAPGADSPASAPAPQSESRRGGCAGCTTTGASSGDLGSAALALGALVLALRRRTRRSTSP